MRKLVSLNFNNNIDNYINEYLQTSLSELSTKYSINFVPQESFGTQQIITDYVKSSTGGIFYGKIYYPVSITSFSGQEIPTSSWVISKINEAIASPLDFNNLFDTRFATKSISDLFNKSHSLLTNISGNGDIHLNSIEVSRVRNYADSVTDGYLRKEDWIVFNNKQSQFSVTAGLNFTANLLSIVPSQIDHNALLNYDINRHLLRDDNATDQNSLWSAQKIISYVSSQIPQQITDFVSKSLGGSFDALVSYSSNIDVETNLYSLVHYTYLNTRLSSLNDSIFATLKGTGTNSISDILQIASITNLGIKDHNLLTNIQGVTPGEYYHLNVIEYDRVANAASSLNDGYLKKEDWILFNSKLGSFSVSIDNLQTDFLRYDSGVMYYNPSKIDHNALLNYNPNRHPLLDDDQTTTTNVWSAAKIQSLLISTDFQSYKIRLNSGATVAQRLVGLVEGVDFPTGWILAADSNALVITHNKNEVASLVSVFSVNEVTGNVVKLEGNVAYSTFTNEYYNFGYNRIRLDAFATVTTQIIIKIIL